MDDDIGCLEKSLERLKLTESNATEKGDTKEVEKCYPRFLEHKTTKVKVVGKPRLGKKLLVLDVDKTIYDCTSGNKFLARRPYLKEFLTETYKEYDIAIWSTTDMKVLEKKLYKLKISNNGDYSIVFCLDRKSTVTIFIKNRTINTKPLFVIWNEFPEYNRQNTVICDDNVYNFYLNPENGILVAPYRFVNYNLDEELKKLEVYLKYLSCIEDITKVSHKEWKLIIQDSIIK